MEKVRVLIADDNRNIAENIQKIILQKDKFEILGIANNGEEEYTMITNLNPEIVFTDNQMPKMNGIDVIKKVHESDLENKPKFVMITSDANKFLYQECAELDIISVVAKPISIERINLILDDIIEMKEEPLIKNNTSSYTKDSFFTKIIRIFKGGKHE